MPALRARSRHPLPAEIDSQLRESPFQRHASRTGDFGDRRARRFARCSTAIHAQICATLANLPETQGFREGSRLRAPGPRVPAAQTCTHPPRSATSKALHAWIALAANRFWMNFGAADYLHESRPRPDRTWRCAPSVEPRICDCCAMRKTARPSVDPRVRRECGPRCGRSVC
jgi:hypothetical protein